MGSTQSAVRRIASGRWRRRSLILALLLASSLALRVAHWVATPHQLCVQHGTLEHLAATSAEHQVSADDGPVVRSTEPSHEECTNGQCARVDLLPELALPDGGTLLARIDGCHAPASEPIPDATRYRLAPSRSPPA